MPGKNRGHYAIVVGINKYAHLGGELRGAVRDAHRFRDWLVAECGGNLPDDPAHITILTGTDGEHPTVAELEQAFIELARRVERSRDENGDPVSRWERLYIFMAGHGTSETINDACLLAADHSDDAVAPFPAIRYADAFATAGLFQEIVVFLDCCRDDKGEHESWMRLRLRKDWVLASRVHRVHGFAAGAGLKARERDFGGNDHRGIFTEALMRAFDVQGGTQTSRLVADVKRHVRSLRETHSQQEARFTLAQQMRFPGPPLPPSISVVVELTDADDEVEVFLGSDLSQVIAAQKTRRPDGKWELKLEPGRLYKLRSRKQPARAALIETTDREENVSL